MSRITSTVSATIGFALLAAALTFAQSNPASSSETSSDQVQAASSQVVQVPTGVMLGRVEHKTMPIYPDEAMLKGIQGDVTLKIEVDETGKITSSVPVAGDPVLLGAAKDALRTFRFHPYYVNGNPVKVQSELGFHFTAQKTADGVSGHVECIAPIPNQP
jgi:TonB family protein